MKLPLHISYAGLGFELDASICHKVCSFSGESGIGKTLGLKILNDYFALTEYVCIALDYTDRDYTEEALFQRCARADIVICDNADLYLTASLVNALCDRDIIVLISSHTNRAAWGKSVNYKIHRCGNKLRIRPVVN